MKKIFNLLTGIMAFLALAAPAIGAGFTPEQVAAHNNEKDCYLLVEGKVYNLTSYLNEHPGGSEIIIANCGGDATAVYKTKGGSGQPHSDKSDLNLSQYYLGDLETQAVAVSAAAEAPAGGGQASMSVNVKAAENGSKSVIPASRYPLLLPIFLAWLVFLVIFYILSRYFGKIFNKLLLMRIASLTMLVAFLMVGSGGVYVALNGYLVINGFNTIVLHVYSGFTFVLAALTHIYIHFREIIGYIRKMIRL